MAHLKTNSSFESKDDTDSIESIIRTNTKEIERLESESCETQKQIQELESNNQKLIDMKNLGFSTIEECNEFNELNKQMQKLGTRDSSYEMMPSIEVNGKTGSINSLIQTNNEKIQKLKPEIGKIQAKIGEIKLKNQELANAQKMGLLTLKNYNTHSILKRKLDEMNSSKQKTFKTVVDNLDKLLMYNNQSFTTGKKGETQYILRCEKYLQDNSYLCYKIHSKKLHEKAPTYLTCPYKSSDMKHTFEINSSTNFEQLKKTFLETKDNANEICRVTTEYLIYIEKLIKYVHIMHNKNLVKKLKESKSIKNKCGDKNHKLSRSEVKYKYLTKIRFTCHDCHHVYKLGSSVDANYLLGTSLDSENALYTVKYMGVESGYESDGYRSW